MRAFLICLVLAGLAFAADPPIDIGLLDGSKLKGRVMSATASEVTVLTDVGVLRIPLEKLTVESKEIITQAHQPNVDSLLKRVAELEARISQLQQENESLRRQLAGTSSPAYQPRGVQAITPTGSTSPPQSGLRYSISSTGKRHNSGCRYFGSGRQCTSTDGVVCKICGG